MIIEHTYLENNELTIPDNKYWFIFNQLTREANLPSKSSGKVKLVFNTVLIIGDSEQECLQYIKNNNIIIDDNLV